MPKAAVKKAARKNAKSASPKPSEIAPEEAVEVPSAPPAPEPPPSPSEMKLEPPTKAVETREEHEPATVTGSQHAAGAVNIAKLQAMAMPDLNRMAREM